MNRIITGWVLILLMTVFTVTAHSSLRYCVCEDVIVLGDCRCEETIDSSVAPCVQSCCDSSDCYESQEQETDPQLSSAYLNSLCHGCLIDLSLHLNDFVINADDSFRSEIHCKMIPLHPQNHSTFSAPSALSESGMYSMRGSPPAIERHRLPLYIRDSVYRL